MFYLRSSFHLSVFIPVTLTVFDEDDTQRYQLNGKSAKDSDEWMEKIRNARLGVGMMVNYLICDDTTVKNCSAAFQWMVTL